MFGLLPGRAMRAIWWDSLRSIVHMVRSITPGQRALPANGVPVYVMLPLDIALPTAQIKPDVLRSYLERLAAIGVHGVMVDCWWRLCEPQPQQYDFSVYVDLANTCRSVDLKLQVVMSFHACGGNIGDNVNIPLPEWVLNAGSNRNIWFVDNQGLRNNEYISFGVDNIPVLPSSNSSSPSAPWRSRTPVQAYAAFTKAFVSAMKDAHLLGSTVTELHVGLGPCGELRYPSYPSAHWCFPGIGAFQCFDGSLLLELSLATGLSGSDKIREASMPPEDLGTYNAVPDSTQFFRKGMYTPEGRFFLQWYSSRLLAHGKDVLGEVKKELGEDYDKVKMAVKISGVHWWKFSKSRAAEAATGYIKEPGKPLYQDIARMLKDFNATLNFTCLEMRTIDQPISARCGPRQLVAEVFRTAEREGVPVAGENALQRFDSMAFGQVAYAMRWCAGQKVGFTLLRLCDELMVKENLHNLESFVTKMRCIDSTK